MTKLDQAAKEYSISNVDASDWVEGNIDLVTMNAFKAGALYQAEQSKVLEKAIAKISKERVVLISGIALDTPTYAANIAIKALHKYRESK